MTVKQQIRETGMVSFFYFLTAEEVNEFNKLLLMPITCLLTFLL